MAKNFPYFKFIATEWLTGDIVFEDFELQGIFINICALYWHRDGVLTIDEVVKRLKSNRVKELENNFLNLNKDGFLSINFLDEQLKEAGHLSKINSDKGKKSALKRASNKENLTAVQPNSTDVQPNSTNKNKNKNKNKIKEERDFVEIQFKDCFEKWLRYKTDRREKYKSIESEKSCYDKLLKLSNYSPYNANEIIEQSISNNWAGLFELKNNNNQLTQHGNKTDRNVNKSNLDKLDEIAKGVLQQFSINTNFGNPES